ARGGRQARRGFAAIAQRERRRSYAQLVAGRPARDDVSARRVAVAPLGQAPRQVLDRVVETAGDVLHRRVARTIDLPRRASEAREPLRDELLDGPLRPLFDALVEALVAAVSKGALG